MPVGKTDSRALEKKIALFGQHNLRDLYFFGPHKDLIGRSVDTLPLEADILRAGLVRLDTRPPIESTNANMPFYLKGELTSINPNFQPEKLKLAISINGIIRGTTEPSIRDERITFTTRIPTESWGAGENSISVYAIFEDKDGEERSLARFREAGASD